jgi:hypothetical protein
MNKTILTSGAKSSGAKYYTKRKDIKERNGCYLRCLSLKAWEPAGLSRTETASPLITSIDRSLWLLRGRAPIGFLGEGDGE